MAIRSGLFDSTEIVDTPGGYPQGNKAEDAEFFASYFAAFIGNGVYGTSFQVVPATGLSVTLKAGRAMINGYTAWDASSSVITLTAAQNNQTKRVILRLDTQNGQITQQLIDSATALNRTAPIYEIALADIYIAANATSISAADITDLRLNPALCGIVTGVIDQLDTTDIAAQLDGVIAEAQASRAALDAYTAAAESDFDVWFAGIQGQLSTDAAGNLQLNKADKTLVNVAAGAVSSALLASGSVTGAKLAAGAVSADKLASDVAAALSHLRNSSYSARLVKFI